MKLEIKELTPDLLEDYLHFFETDAHADNPDEDRCYCVCWCRADHRSGTDFSSPEKRRELAVQYVNSGALQGYLAYADGKAVGWCNANAKSDCLRCDGWLRFKTSVSAAEVSPDIRVKSVYCFAIAPGMKRSGIAGRLLERVCRDAARDGFDFVEAYPAQRFADEFSAFQGPLSMYEKSGFVTCQTVDDKYKGVYDNRYYVVRKPLK